MITLRRLMACVDASVVYDGDATVSGLAIDSRSVRPGDLFMARHGATVDGHDYIQDAVRRGAAAVLVCHRDRVPSEISVPVFFVEAQDPAYALVAAEFYGHPTRELDVYGVTGTNGKSSTVWMLEHLLGALGRRVALLSTLVYRVDGRELAAPNTTPDGIVIQKIARQAVDAGCDAMVMEVSSHGIAMGRIAGTQFRVAGFTNFSRDHLDFHHTEAGYLRAKALLFSLFLRLGEGRRDAVFMEGPRLSEFLEACEGEPTFDAHLGHLRALARAPAPSMTIRTIVSVENSRRADIRVIRRGDSTVGGSPYRIADNENAATVDGLVPIAGGFQLQNAALAMTMVRRVEGTSWAELAAAMERFGGVPGRLELAAAPQGDEPAVFVDYAHTDDALRTVLTTARALTDGPVGVVVGCGGDRDRGKRSCMARAALACADYAVFTTDNPRTERPDAILDDMMGGVSPSASFCRITNRRAAIARVVSEHSEGVCIIAGKGHEPYEDVDGRKWLWRDGDEARMRIAQRRFGLESPQRLCGWSPHHVAGVLSGTWTQRPVGALFGGLSTDTRTLRAGEIFVALKGPNFDGHTHLGRAFAAGASAAIVSRIVDDAPGPQLVVPSTRAALGILTRALIDEARAARGGLQIIGITGSNGKTTTRSFATSLATLRDGRAPLATCGNYNNQVGLPLSVASLSTQHARAVLEMGANRAGDIEELVQMAPPDVAVLTSIAPSHLAGFGSLDGIRIAKSEMVRCAQPRVVVIPQSEVAGVWADAARDKNARVLTFGGAGASLRCHRAGANSPVVLDGDGVWSGFHAEVDVPIPGVHNAGNLAAAVLATSITEGVLGEPPAQRDLERFADTLAAPPGRMEHYDVAGRHIIYDAYNANPGSMRAALQVLSEAASPRVAVLGELLELGAQTDAMHRAVLMEAARCCDTVVAIGSTWPDVSHAHVYRVHDRETAVADIASLTPAGATLLWKGSRGARLELARDAVESIWREEER